MFEKGAGMSFFIFADFFEKGLFPCVGHFGGNPPHAAVAKSPRPGIRSGRKPEDQQSPETLENARKIEDYP